MIARIVFQPIEEMSRVFFSQTLEESDSQPVRRSNLIHSAEILQSLLSIQVVASLVLVALGPSNLPILLVVFLPSKYLGTSAPQLLKAWIFYIPILAVNGLLEAFVTSVATPRDVNKQSR